MLHLVTGGSAHLFDICSGIHAFIYYSRIQKENIRVGVPQIYNLVNRLCTDGNNISVEY